MFGLTALRERGALGLGAPPVTEVHIELEQTCALACIHCSAAGRTCPSHTEVSLGAGQAFLASARGPCVVTFTGGEPLSSRLIFDWIAAVERTERVVAMGTFTSGVLRSGTELVPVSARFASRLVHAGIVFCYISMYSSHGEVHDRVVGRPGAHQVALASIWRLQDAGIDVRAHFVPTRQTLHEVSELLDYLEGLGASELRFLRLARHGNAERNWSAIGLTVEQQATEVLHVLRERGSRGGNIRFTAAGFPGIVPCRPFAAGSGCQAGKHLFYVDTSGRVYPCACAKNRVDAMLGSLPFTLPLSSIEGAPSTVCLQDDPSVGLGS